MDMMRLALIAGGGFLVYKYAQGAGLLPGSGGVTPGVPTEPVVPGAGTTPGGGGDPTAGGTTAPGTGGGNVVTMDPLAEYWAGNAARLATLPAQYAGDGRRYVTALGAVGAADAMAFLESQGVVHNVDQWNWYREQTGAAPVSPDLMPELLGDAPRDSLITVTEYRTRLAGAGLSGLARQGLGWY